MNKIIAAFILLCSISPAFSLESDFLADSINNEVKKPEINLDYNYFDTTYVSVPLQITKDISTKEDDLFEGQNLKFRVLNNVLYKNKLFLKKDEIINAKIKTIITSGMNGIPYTIEVGDFEIQGINPNKIEGRYKKDGFSRTPYVLSLKWALTLLPPTGSLTNLIKGGHAKITKKDKITIYYYPNR